MVERALIVRLGAMGDVIHALPVAAALRARYPGIVLGWVVERRWSELLAAPGSASSVRCPQKPAVDQLHFVDTRHWRRHLFTRRTFEEVRSLIRELRSSRYDLAIDVQGAIKSAVITRLSGATTRLGFAEPREQVAARLYTQRVKAEGRHIVDQNLSLLRPIVDGAGVEGAGFVFPEDAEAERWCTHELGRRGITGPFAILNPGAGWGAKQWPPERFGEVAQQLAERGIVPLVNYSPSEAALALVVEQSSRGLAHRVACSISQLVALTRRARLFIGGDTGPMHLAAALKVPVVALFGPTDPVRNGPYGTKSIVLRSSSSMTSYSHTAQVDPGLLSISSADVVAAADQLLERSHG